MCHQREITIVILVKIWHGFLTLAIPDNQIDLVFSYFILRDFEDKVDMLYFHTINQNGKKLVYN